MNRVVGRLWLRRFRGLRLSTRTNRNSCLWAKSASKLVASRRMFYDGKEPAGYGDPDMPRRATSLETTSRTNKATALESEESRAMNRRRIELILKAHESDLTATEASELDRLTAEYSARVESQVPRSLDFLDELDDRLAKMRQKLLARKSRGD
jgi:hypothetical protein